MKKSIVIFSLFVGILSLSQIQAIEKAYADSLLDFVYQAESVTYGHTWIRL